MAAYRTAELAAQARQMFGTAPEVVIVALNTAGKEAADVEEARKIVREFLDREVK